MKRILVAMVFAVMMLVPLMTVATAAPPAVSSPVEWDGDKGTDSTEECDDEKFGGEAGIHWTISGNDGNAANYEFKIYESGVLKETLTLASEGMYTSGENIHVYTDYYDFESPHNLKANLTFTGTMKHNADIRISHWCDGNGGITEEPIPEFPTIALPIAAIIGLAFIFQRRKE